MTVLRTACDLLTLKAFRPDIRNYRLPFSQREIAEPLMGVAIDRDGLCLCKLEIAPNHICQISQYCRVEDEGDEAMREAMIGYARKHYLRYAIGLLCDGFTIELRSLSPDCGAMDVHQLNADPSAVFGTEVEDGYRYSVIREAGGSNKGLVFAYQQKAIRRLETMVERSPLTFLQIGGGVEWAIRHWHQTVQGKEILRPVDLVVYDRPTIAILQSDQGAFNTNIFCRTDTSGNEPGDSPIVRKGLERYLRSGSQVVFIDLGMEDAPAEETKPSLVALLEEIVGENDLHIESMRHPLQLLLEEGRS